MAVTRDNESAKLTLRVENGVKAGGQTAYVNRNITKLNPVLGDDDTYAVGEALADLQTHTLEGIYVTRTAQLVK